MAIKDVFALVMAIGGAISWAVTYAVYITARVPERYGDASEVWMAVFTVAVTLFVLAAACWGICMMGG